MEWFWDCLAQVGAYYAALAMGLLLLATCIVGWLHGAGYLRDHL